MFRHLFFGAFIVCQLLAIISSNICRNLNYPMTRDILPQNRHKVKYLRYIINMKDKIKSILFIVFPLVGGIIVSLLTNTKSYKAMLKPFLSPPAIVFPIAWTILYLLMGISLYIVLKANKEMLKPFLIQLFINYLWPFIFFSLKKYVLSAIILLLLIACVIDMIIKFYNTKKIAGILQFPYFIWLLFALYLNIGVAILN